VATAEILYERSARLRGVTVKVAEGASRGIEAGETLQPSGTSRRTAPAAFSTLRRTATETGKDLASSGTMPARGEIATLTAGATANGSETVPRPVTRRVVCTTWPMRIGTSS
jgi:hypothetical protein